MHLLSVQPVFSLQMFWITKLAEQRWKEFLHSLPVSQENGNAPHRQNAHQISRFRCAGRQTMEVIHENFRAWEKNDWSNSCNQPIKHWSNRDSLVQFCSQQTENGPGINAMHGPNGAWTLVLSVVLSVQSTALDSMCWNQCSFSTSTQHCGKNSKEKFIFWTEWKLK